MAIERVFVDTWGWLVLANRRDPAFDTVSRLRSDVAGRTGVWVTTDYVLDETMTRLFSISPFSQSRRFMEGIFEASRQELLDVEHVTQERFTAAWRLRLRYRDKARISFTDLTSFVVMQELLIRKVITADAHFEQVGLGFVRLP